MDPRPRTARVQVNPEAAKGLNMPVKNRMKATFDSDHFNIPSSAPTSLKPNPSVTPSPGPEVPSGYTSNIIVPIAIGGIALGFAFVLFFLVLESFYRQSCKRKYEAISDSSEDSDTDSLNTKKFLYDAYKGFQTSDENTSSSGTVNSYPVDTVTAQTQVPINQPSTSGLNLFDNDEVHPTKSQNLEGDDLLNPFLNPDINEEEDEEETKKEAVSIGERDRNSDSNSYRVNGLTLKDPETEDYNPFLSTEDDITHEDDSEGSESITPFDSDTESDVYDYYDPGLNPFSEKQEENLFFTKGDDSTTLQGPETEDCKPSLSTEDDIAHDHRS